jgi:hypothetical protein
MAYKNVCIVGSPAGGRVREDDIPGGASAAAHDAGGPSPGILKFIDEVVRALPNPNVPPKPTSFPPHVDVDTYPGRGNADVHFEGRAVDVSLNYSSQQAEGDWLFDWCVANCTRYRIQGVIFGPRQWFSEAAGGSVTVRGKHDHFDHVHVELNCDGANLSY